MESAGKQKPLAELAKLFLKLGCIGFGGPAVHIAMMEEEVVRKRKWLTNEQFLDLIGATNLIPGPNSTEMTMHIGQQRAGWKGLVVAGLCFILTAVLITGGFAYAYQVYGKLPEVQPFLYGVKPAIISVGIAMMISLTRKALKSFELGLIGLTAILLAFYGVNDIYILFGTVNMVSIALIVTVCVEMGKASIVDWRTILIAIIGFVVTLKFKHLNSAFVIIGGAGLGYVLSMV
jgi:chromate transporter